MRQKYLAFWFISIPALLALPLTALGQGENNPTGVSGIYNGNSTTGSKYDPFTQNGMRVVDDLVVPGSVGAYPLKWTRYYNSRNTPQIELGQAGWTASYLDYELTSQNSAPYGIFPDGRKINFDEAIGVGERTGPWTDVDGTVYSAIFLTDGGKVIFSSGIPIKLIDPYGQITTIVYDPVSNTTRITEPGGRFLQINYGTSPVDTSTVILSVQAYDGTGSGGKGNLLGSVTYSYARFTDRSSGLGAPVYCTVLTGATYSDGTSAAYTYQRNDFTTDLTNPTFYPVLDTADDMRAEGPMRQIAYGYNALGRVTNELKMDRSVSPARVTLPDDKTRTETRGDGAQRTFFYSVGKAEPTKAGRLQWYTDFRGKTTYLGYDGNGFLNLVTDARGSAKGDAAFTTTYLRGPVAGEVLRITHPDGTHLDQTYSDPNNPYYLASRTDERGKITHFTRDGNNRVMQIDYPTDSNTPPSNQAFTYNNFGQILTHQLRNGAYQHFKYDARGLLLAKTNPTINASWSGSLANDSQTTCAYYTSGPWTDRIQTETDPRGNGTTYEYDVDSSGLSRGLITKITHNVDGTYQAFGYDTYGEKVWQENELRQRTNFTYDQYKRLASVTTPPPISGLTTYDYSSTKGNPAICYKHTTNSPYFVTDPTNIVTANTYDPDWHKASTTDGSGTSLAATTQFQYDEVGNQTAIIDPRNIITGMQYDGRNRKTDLIVAVGDPLQQTTHWNYDEASNVTSIVRTDGTSEVKTYDAVNRMLTDTMPKDGTPTAVTSTISTSFSYNPSGTIQSLTVPQSDAVSLTTTFLYDPSDLKTQMTYPNGDHQKWTYDADHNLIARQTVNLVSQLFSYDSRNRQIAMTWSNAADWASFGYDAANRMTLAQNPTSTITRVYDEAGRMTLDRQQLQISPVTAVSRKTHGSAGTFDITLPLTGTPGIECRKGQGPNADQHQIVVTFPRAVTVDHASVTSGGGSVANTSTSDDGTQVTVNLASVSNAHTIIVTLSGVTDGTVTNDVNVGISVLLGDTTGNGVVTSTDISQTQSQSGQSVTTSNFREDVNVNGLITSADISLVQSMSGTGLSGSTIPQTISSSPNFDVNYEYDDAGKAKHLYALKNGDSVDYDYTFGYDAIGRFETISHNGGGQLFQYSYDTASNLTHRTNGANGIDQVYTPDALNRVKELDLVKAGSTIAFEAYGYDSQRPGLLTSITRKDGKQDQFAYDLLPELISAQYGLGQGSGATDTDSNGDDVDPIAYGDHANGYDPTGLIGFGNPDGGGGSSGFGNPDNGEGGGSNLLIDQPIDPDSAQTNWSSPNRTVSYAWDKAGNRSSVTDSGVYTPYSTNSLNQYWQVGSDPVAGAVGRGSEHELSSYRTVVYKYINDTHLSSTTRQSDSSSYYLNYDALGRCVVRVLNGVTNYYVYDGEKAILEYGNAYGLGAWNLYGRGIDEILMRSEYLTRPSGTSLYTVYYQDDRNGNTTHLTDETGNVVEWYRYDAFGAPTFFNASVPAQTIGGSNWNNRFLFTGREYMLTFSVYEYRNRAYHPGLGRFMSEDPKLFDAGDNNFFRYCGNDPEDKTDPMGQDGIVTQDPSDANQINLRLPYVYSGFTAAQMAVFEKGFHDYWTGRFGKFTVTASAGPPTLKETLLGRPVNHVWPTDGASKAEGKQIFWNPQDGALGAAHEGGHAFGAPHSGNDPHDVMATGVRPLPNSLPSERDIQRILDAKGKGVTAQFPKRGINGGSETNPNYRGGSNGPTVVPGGALGGHDAFLGGTFASAPHSEAGFGTDTPNPRAAIP